MDILWGRGSLLSFLLLRITVVTLMGVIRGRQLVGGVFWYGYGLCCGNMGVNFATLMLFIHGR